eukprot:5481668-Ditylum_brightwellii.AAC.1
MARKAPTVEEIINNFPHPTVPRITGEPTYNTIHTVHKILQENAASIHSNKGGGADGHLALVLTLGHYQQVTRHVFAAPTYPGPNPPNPRIFMLQHKLQAQRDRYYATLSTFATYRNMIKALTKQILTSFDERFYKVLRYGIVGYNNRTMADFLHCLYGNNRQITLTMIAHLEVKMAQPFNPTAPIEDLFEQINNGQDLTVAAGLRFLDIQLATKAYNLIYKTGVHNDACKEWNCCLAVDRTYAN